MSGSAWAQDGGRGRENGADTFTPSWRWGRAGTQTDLASWCETPTALPALGDTYLKPELGDLELWENLTQ